MYNLAKLKIKGKTATLVERLNKIERKVLTSNTFNAEEAKSLIEAVDTLRNLIIRVQHKSEYTPSTIDDIDKSAEQNIFALDRLVDNILSRRKTEATYFEDRIFHRNESFQGPREASTISSVENKKRDLIAQSEDESEFEDEDMRHQVFTDNLRIPSDLSSTCTYMRSHKSKT